jgi:hypothetical protein
LRRSFSACKRCSWNDAQANEHHAGKLGVVEEGALADLLPAAGDPLANIKLIEDPARNLLVIMNGREDLQECRAMIRGMAEPGGPSDG